MAAGGTNFEAARCCDEGRCRVSDLVFPSFCGEVERCVWVLRGRSESGKRMVNESGRCVRMRESETRAQGGRDGARCGCVAGFARVEGRG